MLWSSWFTSGGLGDRDLRILTVTFYSSPWPSMLAVLCHFLIDTPNTHSSMVLLMVQWNWSEDNWAYVWAMAPQIIDPMRSNCVQSPGFCENAHWLASHWVSAPSFKLCYQVPVVNDSLAIFHLWILTRFKQNCTQSRLLYSEQNFLLI